MTATGIITLTRALSCGASQAGGTDNPGPEQGSNIGGLIVEYGVDATPSGPFERVRFADGAIQTPAQLSHIKLLRDHDLTQPVGVMTGLDPVENGLSGSFRIGRHPAGVEAAGLVEDQILDGLSVGVLPVEYHEEEGTTVITRGELFEVSLVTIPAISSARAVMASQNRKEDPVNAPAPVPTNPDPTPAPEAPELRDVMAQLAALSARMDATAPAAPAPLPDGALPAHTYDVQRPDGTGRVISATQRTDFPGVRASNGRLITAGDYFASFAAGALRGEWGEHQAIQAALADQVTSDTPGLLPQQIVGALLGRASGNRPVWDSFRSSAMPMIGGQFSRPRITQHVKVDEQKTQKTEVASQKYTVVLDDVAKTTLAGALDIAQQAIDWTSPALLNELIFDFTAKYVGRTEKLACDALVKAATADPVAWDGTAAKILDALVGAAAQVYEALGEDQDAMPTTAWISTDIWALLAALKDTTGRAIFPALGPTNASGTMDISRPDQGPAGTGFRWVVGRKLPKQTFIVGDASFTESYENGRRFLQAVRPELLGLDLAYMGYAATYMPYGDVLVPIKTPAPKG
ncbi:HK97 family phage prohead protease [Catenulispora sp. NF23]|uniref:HK97 family phage prohead protease n=1 Tax=Catenulispora pinistramenti TaxID=2705254 RepID=UPI001BA98F4C|nr:HK97 family phage prohead protease [Catenulispora pinistramenti]MBS2533859.1 HK97 family phage prohead protease [Catenulispora pinistramenti]